MADLPNPPEPDGPTRRDHGIRRVSTATRWTVAAAAAGSAALGLTYANLTPGTSGAPAPAQGTPPTAVACTQQPAAPAPATTTDAPTRGGRAQEDGEDDEERAVPAAAPAPSTATPQPTVTCTPLTPPAQAPAPTQQAPQTRTGAS
ncbi:hypothetical protein ACFVHB_09785 [Kitasatospora sp. NPDC127111]|uniref:hypothetical protein n=1 Tax=Kitasatospora sp. NPDC127111 TaxID=3345363 RepID=UPI00362F88C1